MTRPDRPTREECIAAAAQEYVDGLAEVTALLAAGRAREAAELAGYRTDTEIDAWIARNTVPLRGAA